MNWTTIIQGIVIGEATLAGLWLLWIMIILTIKEFKK